MRHRSFHVKTGLVPHSFLLALILLPLLALPGCSRHAANFIYLYNGPDKPLPDSVVQYLEPSRQSLLTPAIREAATPLEAPTRRERMLKAIEYVWQNFEYDNREAHLSFTKTADDLFRSGVLGGCSDYALVQVVLFRALQIPARLVVTADVEWMGKYKKNNLYMTRGHVFIEVFLEQDWYLVDPSYRTFYTNYQPAKKSYPRGLYLYTRAVDYWQIGIREIGDVDRVLRAMALMFDPDAYMYPGYNEIYL